MQEFSKDKKMGDGSVLSVVVHHVGWGLGGALISTVVGLAGGVAINAAVSAGARRRPRGAGPDGGGGQMAIVVLGASAIAAGLFGFCCGFVFETVSSILITSVASAAAIGALLVWM